MEVKFIVENYFRYLHLQPFILFQLSIILILLYIFLIEFRYYIMVIQVLHRSLNINFFL